MTRNVSYSQKLEQRFVQWRAVVSLTYMGAHVAEEKHFVFQL